MAFSIQSPLFSSYLKMHLSVLLWGGTAILGKLISLDAFQLVFWRMSLAAGIYLCVPTVWRLLQNTSLKTLLRLASIGLIIAIHWISFYYSIKVGGSASLTLSCLGTGPMFVIWVNYLLGQKKQVSGKDWLLTLLSLCGMILVGFGRKDNGAIPESYFWAIGTGILASALAAVFSVANKKMTKTESPLLVSSVEMISGALLLGLTLCQFGNAPTPNVIAKIDWLWLLILAILCTNIPFWMSISALQKIPTLSATLIVNLEPIYGYLMAAFLFSEFNSLNIFFYLGAGTLLLSVFLLPYGGGIK